MAAAPALDPIITIQNEYQIFLQRYRDHSTGLRRDSLTPRTPLYVSMDPNEPNFVCTRDSFYLSLLHFARVDRQGSIDRFHKCAQQGFPGAAATNPVDTAIHAFSILISDLIYAERRPEARDVIEFLQIDYTDEMNDPRSQRMYNRSKNEVLLLLGDNGNALRVCPIELRTEVLQLVHYLFRNEQRYIASSPLAKKVISKFVIRYRQPIMIQVYEQLTPLSRAHFFVYILENNINVSPVMMNQIEIQLLLPNSPLENLIRSNLYPNASQAAQEIRQDIMTRRVQPPPVVIREFGGSKKRTLRKVKSKSYTTHKKKIKRKSRRYYRYHQD
jgi:hypothetical protein